jgi:hypothetical protein
MRMASPTYLSIVPPNLESDLRHLSQIMVEELRQILGFEPLSRLRKAFEIGEKDR